jgi:Lrp/AsnC family leucine-responsive transcriptional regulator
MKPLDQIDRKILRALQKDGRMTNADLSKHIHLSPTPCLDRVRRLEREGYIESYHAKLSADKMKMGFMTFLTVSLDQTNEAIFEGFKKAVKGIDEIVECHMVGGGFDYLLKIRTESMAQYRQLMGERFSEIPGISSTNSYFVMEEIKNTRFYKIPNT